MPTVTAPLPDLVIYGRPGCHLCDQAHEALDAILAQRGAAGLPVPKLEARNIESNDAWLARYVFTIPVVEIAGRQVELATSAARLSALLAEVLDTA
jgi:hypothetical protein